MDSFKETCIWMSYRYAIGRRSIASVTHAYDIIKHGYDWISENRKEFTASDIRSEINNRFSWHDNVAKEGYDDHFDVISCIAKYMYNQNVVDPEIYFNTHYWIVNVNNGLVFADELIREHTHVYFQTEFHDYQPWILLANVLDQKRKVLLDVTYKSKRTSYECFMHYIVSSDGVEKRYVPIKDFLQQPYPTKYINPEYIINNEQ